MARNPLNIPWNLLLTDRDGPAPELAVVGATAPAGTGVGGGGGGGEGGRKDPQEEGCPVAVFTDLQLAEKIDRVKNQINSIARNLPDKGAKLRANLRQLQEEQERQRKKLARTSKKDVEECEEVTRYGISVCSDSLKKFNSSSASSQSCTQSSFGSHFSKLLEGKTNSDNCAAFSEELRSIGKDHSKNSGQREQNGEKHHSRMSWKLWPFRLSTSFDNKDKQRISDGDYKGIASPNSSTPQLGKGLSSHSPKRRKPPENHASQDLKSAQVQDVVLLDEDVVPVQKIPEADELDEQKEAKMYYPSRDHSECVELCYSDIKCLDPDSYLSSTIMNFYIRYLQKPFFLSGMPRGEYHFFNTYFYRKLEEALSFRGENNQHFTKLRRWWKGVNIFQKAYIFIPIHGDLHWSLVIICIPAKEDESGPIILHLDSLGLHTSNLIFENIERYLKEEWKYINKNACSQNLPLSERIWNNLPNRIEKKKIPVPQQKNKYDCGLFVLYFIERFLGKAPDRIKRKDLAMFSSKWFQPEEASALRKRLRELLLEEFESARLNNDGAESPEAL